MARLTRKQTKSLEFALRHAVRALEYVMSPDVAIARKGGAATTTLHYTRADGAVLYEVCKDIGSDLTGLPTAVAELRTFLATNGGI
jgi:hypothetical protein